MTKTAECAIDVSSAEGVYCLERNKMFEEKIDLMYCTFSVSVKGIQLHMSLWKRGSRHFIHIEEYLLLDHRGAAADVQPVSHLSIASTD
jgi:hypothetical protein